MKEVAVGIDIGGTYTKFGIVTRDGTLLGRNKISTNSSRPAEVFFSSLCESVNKIIDEIDEEIVVKGIGMGAPNGNFFTGTIENAPNLDWEGVVHAKDLIHRDFDLPVAVTNDANAAALGEMQFGAAQGMKDFIVITLGTGLGSGIVANGQLIYGHDGFAGELGHTIVDYEGRACGCGRRGCLETYVSATGVVRTAVEWMKNSDRATVLRDMMISDLDSSIITRAARNGDSFSLEVLEFTGKVLGRKLADAVAFTSPEAIILFGGLARAGDLIFKPTRKHLQANLLNIYKNKVKLLPSGLPQKNTAVLGAAALIWQEMK